MTINFLLMTKKKNIYSVMKRITPVCIATFMQGTSIGILIPVITHYVLSMGASEQSAPLIFSTFLYLRFYLVLCGVKLSIKGRKFVMFFSILGITIAYAWLAVASTVWEIFASRAFAGIMSGFNCCICLGCRYLR